MNRFLVLVALLSGCTSINYKDGPVPGLENMTVEEHQVDATEIYQRCSRCGSHGIELPTACTCINFRTGRAVIWLARGASQATIEHERAHGRGYDHQNGELRSQYASWAKGAGTRINLPSKPTYRAETDLTKLSELKSVTPAE